MPDSRKPTAADHAWAEQQARQIEAAMPGAVEGDLEKRAALIASDIDPLRAATVLSVGSGRPRPFYAVDREVSVRMRGVKRDESLPGYIKLDGDPLFAFVHPRSDDDLLFLTPLGCAVAARLSSSIDTSDGQ